MTSPTFAKLVAASGLSEVFASRVVERACARAFVSPDRMTRADIAAVFPHLEVAMRLYLNGHVLTRALHAVSELCEGDE